MRQSFHDVGLDQMDEMLTEQVDPRYGDIDAASVEELAELMNDADATVPAAVRAAMGQIVPAIEAITDRLARGGRLFYVGAGTAGRIGVLDASECVPTFNTPPDLVQGVIAGGHEAIVNPSEGAEDDVDAGTRVIEVYEISEADAVVGIAASGRTPFVLAAVRGARLRGALTVSLSCNVATPLSSEAEHPIEVPVGPEVLAGSTRLKAGTAQKLVLNMISTIAMVRLGKTYGNLMVDVRPTSRKLRARALALVERIAGCSPLAARRALGRSHGSVKTAIVIARLRLSPAQARRRLARHHGSLRRALRG